MKKSFFIVALILIGETLFRLFPYPSEKHAFFPFNNIELHTDTYLYFLFEYVKVIGLVTILCIENTRWNWLRWMFVLDLAVYLLYYSSTIGYISGFPIGMDLVKLVIFGAIVISEALRGRENYSDSDERGHLDFDAPPELSEKVRFDAPEKAHIET